MLPPPRARVSRPQEHEGVQTVQTESLLAYEASSDDAVLDTSVQAWSSLLSSLGVEPSAETVRRRAGPRDDDPHDLM